MAVGVSASVVSGFFTARFLSTYATSGADYCGAYIIAMLLTVAQMSAIIVGVRFWNRIKMLSYPAFGLFAFLLCLSLCATVGALTDNFGEISRSVKGRDSDYLRLRQNIDELVADKRHLQDQNADALVGRLFTRVIDPNNIRIKAIEDKLEKLRMKADAYVPASDDDAMYTAMATAMSFFWGRDKVTPDEIRNARLYALLLFAIVLELVSPIFLAAGMFAASPEESPPDTGKMTIPPQPVQMDTQTVNLKTYIENRGTVRRRAMLASKVLKGAQEYDPQLIKLVMSGQIQVEPHESGRESDTIYKIA